MSAAMNSGRVEVAKTLKLYVNGAFPRSESGRTVLVFDAKKRAFAHASHASRKDLRDAVEAASAAQPKWAAATAYNRGQVLYRLAEMLEARRAEFASLMVSIEGRTKAEAAKEVDRAIDRCVCFAGWTDKIAAVLGGSLGAQALNACVPEALAQLPAERRPIVVHQSGRDHLDGLQANYARAGVEATLLPFIDDMAQRYAEADFVIARAGATTIAELACAGLASVLVPFPHAVDDHQTVNARFLVERGAAWLIPQAEFTPERLAQQLASIDRPALLSMAERARSVAKPGATYRVAQVCMEAADAP